MLTSILVSRTRVRGLMCRLTLTTFKGKMNIKESQKTNDSTSFNISLWAFLALAASVLLAFSNSSFLSLSRIISLSVSLPPLRSSTLNQKRYIFREEYLGRYNIALHLVNILIGLLLATVALLKHILVPGDQGGQIAHRDVAAHLNWQNLKTLPRQGCISCGILVSGIRARGVSSEHMEIMEMFSCSPT